jgi:hypothetical protein
MPNHFTEVPNARGQQFLVLLPPTKHIYNRSFYQHFEYKLIFLQISDHENKNYKLFDYEHFQLLKTTKLHEKQV